jgi:hypothetical protein
MRKLTNGYIKQLLNGSTPFPVDYPQELIELKRAHVHLVRVLKFREKENNGKLNRSEKLKANQAYRDADAYFQRR